MADAGFSDRWMRRHPSAVSVSGVVVSAETPDQPEVRAFFAASEAYMGALYPAESNHFAPVSTLLQPNVLFLVARHRGVAVGCGALVISDDSTAEIKRMWVDPAERGIGLGRFLLEALVTAGREERLRALQLETGIHQPEAIGLYRVGGFVERPPFATYAPDPLSIFMELKF